LFKTFFSRNKFPAKIILLTLVFCFVFIPTGFSAEGGSFNWPLKGEVITCFGSYVHSVSGETKSHSGIDIKGTPDSEIFAAADGTIYFSGFTPAGGNDSSVKNTITILHSNGYKTTYLQLKDISVNKGDNVLQGQAIGKLAISGDVSSPETHLHFGIKDENGNPVNPENFLLLGSSGQDNSSASSEVSNSAPVETSDNSLSSGPPETSVVISEGSLVQSHSDPVQTSEAKNNVQVDSINVVSESVKDETPQESIVSSGDSGKQLPQTEVFTNGNVEQSGNQPVVSTPQNQVVPVSQNIQTAQITIDDKQDNDSIDNIESKTEVGLSNEVFVSQKDKNDNKNQISNSSVSIGNSSNLLQKLFLGEDKDIINNNLISDGLMETNSLFYQKIVDNENLIPKINITDMKNSDSLVKESESVSMNDNVSRELSIKKYLSQFRSLSFEAKENDKLMDILLIILSILALSVELKKLRKPSFATV
jgi:hypothetical protein